MSTPFVPAFKVGSGEIDWIEALEHMAGKGKPMILATGAADIADVQRAVHAILRLNTGARVDAVQYQLHGESRRTMTTSTSTC